MRTVIIIGMAGALAVAFAAHAMDEAAVTPDEYVVWVEELHLRAEPSTEAEVITVLGRGDRAEYLRPKVIEKEDYIWRKVRYGEYVGWVADRYVLREDIFDAFKDVILNAGDYDSRGMLDAIVEGNRRMGVDPKYEANFWSVSPNNKKVMLEVDFPFDLDRDYQDYGFSGQPEPVLYFVSGKGLIDYLKWGWHERGSWDETSRYYVCPACALDEYPLPLDLIVYDTEDGEPLSLGPCLQNTDIPIEEWEANNEPHLYQFADGYLIWFTVERARAVDGDIDLLPVLMGYELSSGRKFKLLEADITTMKDERIPGRSWDYYEVKLVPAGVCPDVIKETELYKKYNGVWEYAWSSNA
jgi:hypothetical protein